METFKDRIEKLVAWKSNPNNLATELGTSPSNIYGYLSGKADTPSVKMMKKFERIGVNTDWLMNGRGEMFGEKSQEEKSQEEKSSDYIIDLLTRIEQSFVGHFEKTIETQEKIINTQQRLIENLMGQLGVGKPNPITEQTGVFTFEKPAIRILRLAQ